MLFHGLLAAEVQPNDVPPLMSDGSDDEGGEGCFTDSEDDHVSCLWHLLEGLTSPYRPCVPGLPESVAGFVIAGFGSSGCVLLLLWLLRG